MTTKKKVQQLDEIGFIGMQQWLTKEEFQKELKNSSAAIKQYKLKQSAKVCATS